MRHILALSLLVLSNCAATVVPMGRDTWMIEGGARASNLVAEAGEFCADRNQSITVQRYQDGQRGYYNPDAKVIFRCLDAKDPAAQVRPDYHNDPTIVVQH